MLNPSSDPIRFRLEVCSCGPCKTADGICQQRSSGSAPFIERQVGMRATHQKLSSRMGTTDLTVCPNSRRTKGSSEQVKRSTSVKARQKLARGEARSEASA